MASMTVNLELDPVFRSTLKLLHSPSPDSAEKIRNTLDEIIKQRFGSSKMLVNTLSKKILAEECSVPGTRIARTKSIETKSSSANVTITVADELGGQLNEVINVPQAIVMEVPTEMETDDDNVIEDQFKELEDLMCIVCRQMDVSVRNRLVECIDCHSLYHQDCHKPTISETDANEATWLCTMCKTTKIITPSPVINPPITTSSTHISIPSTPSKMSSHSSSGYSSKSSTKNYESSSSSSSSSESKKSKSSRSSPNSSSKSSSSKSSSKNQESQSLSSTNNNGSSLERQSSVSSSNGTSSSKTVTPNINIISADKRLQIMKKKAAKLHESKRSKHK